MHVDLALATVAAQRRKLKVDQLEPGSRHRARIRGKDLAHPEIIEPRMIRLLLEVANVLTVIVSPIFRGHLEAAVWEHPSRENLDELIVLDTASCGIGWKTRIVWKVVGKAFLQKSLKRLRQITSWNARARPDGMKESCAP